MIRTTLALFLFVAAGPVWATCANQITPLGMAATAGHTDALRRAYPEVADAAALLARVDPDQRGAARTVAVQKLRELGRYNDDAFAALMNEAERGVTMSDNITGTLGALAGGAVGLGVGKVVDSAIGGGNALTIGSALGFGGAGAGLARAAAGHTIKIVASEQLQESVFDELFRNPCEMTAAQALERLRVD